MNHNEQQDFATASGLEVNANGGFYSKGKRLPIEKKAKVAMAMSAAMNGDRPYNVSAIAQECKVSRTTVQGVAGELASHGRLLTDKERKPDVPTGVGSKTLDVTDEVVLYLLYLNDVSRSTQSYVSNLENLTGNRVSQTTINNWFKTGFPFKASLVNANIVPRDKFRPDNLIKAREYLTILTQLAPERIKFGDEKLLRGSEVYCRKNRRNPFTGEVPANVVPPDFRDTYCIIGFCGIDLSVSPLRFNITKEANNLLPFLMAIEQAITTGFLKQNDIIVLDNAAIHVGGKNSYLGKWLWDNFRIFLLLLPARTPEWNPIELVWLLLVK